MGSQGGGGTRGHRGAFAIFAPMEVHLGLGPSSYALVIKDQGKHHRERGSRMYCPFNQSINQWTVSPMQEVVLTLTMTGIRYI